MQIIKDNLKKSVLNIIVIVIACMAITGMYADTSYGTISRQPVPSQIETIKSSNTYTKEYIKVRTPKKVKSTIYVSGKVDPKIKMLCIRVKKHNSSKHYIRTFVIPNSKGEFSIKINTKKGNKKVPVVLEGKGRVPKAKLCKSSKPGTLAVEKMPAGTYHLFITGAVTTKDADISRKNWDKGTLSGSDGYVYREALMTIKSGQNNNPKLVQYNEVIDNNKAIRGQYEKQPYNIDSYKGSYVRYRDPYLKDTPLVLYNPKTKKYDELTSKQVAYISKVTKNVTKGAASDFQKAAKIYEFTAKNLYYDNYALDQRKNQYANPYQNIYKIKNKTKSENSVKGKVATTCQGYAAMVVAMARAEGIPARFAYGRHIRQHNKIWTDVSSLDMTSVTHYWPELYIDGRWMLVDARPAMSSRWIRSSFTDKGVWDKDHMINYAHLDPPYSQSSNSYIYLGILPGSTDGKYINRTVEVEKLRAFLDSASDGVKNGKKLNSSYSRSDFSTWGNGSQGNFTTDGFGQVTEISWPEENLTGDLDVSKFTALTKLDVNRNNIDSINVKGCSSLKYIYAIYSGLTELDCTSSTEIKKIHLAGCKLEQVKFKHNKKTVTIKCTEGGSFGLRYSKGGNYKLRLRASEPEEGYVYKGIYDKKGRCVSESYGYSFTPIMGEYTIKYERVEAADTEDTTGSEIPSDPEDATESENQNEPEDATDPEDATEPEDTTDPEDATEPENPTEQ